MFSSHCTLLPRDDVRTLIFMYLLEICSSGRQNHNVLISSEKKKRGRVLVPVIVSFSHLNWHFPKVLKTHDTPVILLVKSFHERNVIYDDSVVFQLQSTVFLDVSERVCARFPFSFFLFFFLSLGASETVREYLQSFSTPGQRLFYYEAHAHAGPSVGVTAKWMDAKRG